MSVFVTMTLKSGKESRHWHSGQGIGQYTEADELNSVAEAAGVVPLQSFYVDDEFYYVEPLEGCSAEVKAGVSKRLLEVQLQTRWHEPSVGIKTVLALIEHYRKKRSFN